MWAIALPPRGSRYAPIWVRERASRPHARSDDVITPWPGLGTRKCILLPTLSEAFRTVARMAISFRSATLGELTPEALSTMLGEHETLFVEHKTDIAKGSGKSMSAAVASFANALGGWVLIGVGNDGKPDPSWSPPAGDFVDAVRQRLEANIDPMPSFAARVVETEDGHRVGVVRVYESADTPHLVDGTVYVREPAKNRKTSAQPPYEPTPVRSHYELAQLVQRGEKARDAAWGRVKASGVGDVHGTVGLQPGAVHPRSGMPLASIDGKAPSLALALAPLTMTESWRSWPTSARGVQTLKQLSADLAAIEPGIRVGRSIVRPRSTKTSALSQAIDGVTWTSGGAGTVFGLGSAHAHRLGFLHVVQHFIVDAGSGTRHWHRDIQTGEPVAALFRSALAAVVRALADAELLGRYAVLAALSNVGRLYSDPRARDTFRVPSPARFDGELVVDGREDPADDPALHELTSEWALELCREAGMEVWAP